MSSKDNDEERVMQSKRINIEMMINDKGDKVIEELVSTYQVKLETSIKGSDFIFDCVHLLC